MVVPLGPASPGSTVPLGSASPGSATPKQEPLKMPPLQNSVSDRFKSYQILSNPINIYQKNPGRNPACFWWIMMGFERIWKDLKRSETLSWSGGLLSGSCLGIADRLSMYEVGAFHPRGFADEGVSPFDSDVHILVGWPMDRSSLSF